MCAKKYHRHHEGIGGRWIVIREKGTVKERENNMCNKNNILLYISFCGYVCSQTTCKEIMPTTGGIFWLYCQHFHQNNEYDVHTRYPGLHVKP